MNNLSHALLAAVLCCATTLAQANASYSASFNLEGGRLPALRTGTGIDGPDTLPGDWLGRRQDATINSRDLLASTVNPDTGVLEHSWGELNHSDNMHRAGGPPLWMGESHADIHGYWSRTHSSAGVYHDTLSVNANLVDPYADVKAHATFAGDFSLDARSSFTFSGFATLGIAGDPTPLNAFTTFNNNDLSFASLTLGDLFGRVRTTIGASLWGVNSGLGDVFSYKVGPNGLLALTITNNSDSALLGTVTAGSYIALSAPDSYGALAAPVPEPETWLLLMAGAGIVGFSARKRQPAQALPTQA